MHLNDFMLLENDAEELIKKHARLCDKKKSFFEVDVTVTSDGRIRFKPSSKLKERLELKPYDKVKIIGKMYVIGGGKDRK